MARRNLSTNPSLETSTTGHAVVFVRSGITVGAVSRSNTIAALSGTYYGFVNVTGAADSPNSSDFDIGFPTATVVAGQQYTASVYLRHSVAGIDANLVIEWRTSGGALISTSQGGYNVVASTSWSRHTVTATAPATATQARAVVWVDTVSDTASRSFRWDAVLVEQAVNAGTYFDGSTAGATWDGTAHASTSTLAVAAAATLPVVAALSADLRRVYSGGSSLPVNVSVTADPLATAAGGVALPTVVALSVRGVAAAATLPVTASITADVARSVAAAATAAVAVGLTADGTVQGGAASANLPVTTALALGAGPIYPSPDRYPSESTYPSSTGGVTVTTFGAAAIGVTTGLTAGAAATAAGTAAAFGVTADLTPNASTTATAGSYLTVDAALATADPTRVVPGAANLGVTTALAALATGVPAGGASLAVVATLTSGAALTAGASVALTVQITLGAGEPLPTFEPPPPYQVGDVGPTSLPPRAPVTHWELLVAETRTGTVLAELPFTDLNWNTPLNDIGTLTATIPVEAHVAWLGPSDDRSPINRLRTVLSGEWKLSLCATFDNTPIIAGPLITSTPVTGEANVTVGCAELGALLKRRIVRTPGTDPAGLGSDLALGPTSLPQLARLLVEKATASANEPGWNLPLILPDLDTRGDHVRTYLGSDLADYWTRLSDLAGVQDGPDLRFEPELTDVTGGRKLWWRVRIGQPWLGTWIDGENPPAPPWIFDLGAGLRDLTTDRDASAMTMRTYVPGQARTEPAATTSSTDTSAPQDAPKPIGTAANLTLIDAGYPILEDVDGSHTSATEQRTLDAWAVAGVAANNAPVEAWNVTVDGASSPRLGQWRIGDTATFVVHGQNLVTDGEHERRIVGASGNAGTDVTLVLTPVPAAV